MATPTSRQTTCGSLLQELQKIWDEIGENDNERDKMLFHLEQECLDIYKRKVEQTRKYKADLHKVLAEAEAEFANLVSSLGEHRSFSRENGTLKEQISAFKPLLEELRAKKQDRVKEISEIQLQIIRTTSEITGSGNSEDAVDLILNERDLSVKMIGELKLSLQDLQNEKSLRLQKVNSYLKLIHELSVVLGINFAETIADIHPSLSTHGEGHSRSVSNETLAKLTGVIYSLNQEKLVRLQKLQSFGSMLVELWQLMDIPAEEQQKFYHVVHLNTKSVDDVNGKECLSQNVIEQAEMEVERLNILKASKMKELVLKRQDMLEEIYRGVHMDVDSETTKGSLISLIESGSVDISDLLSTMDRQITKAKEEAASRKEILDKLEKWRFASAEEIWLDEYERDDNRFTAGRGAHKNLKRAEKARILVNKIPSMVENLTAKVKTWEAERTIPFLYDKEPVLRTLEECNVRRQEREEEKRRARDQKKMQEQLATEKEAIFGSKPSVKRPLGVSSNNGNTIVGTPIGRRVGTPARFGLSTGKERRESGRTGAMTPINYVALAKDDSATKGH
ncbi:unnamed protein product [Rhodiola kirilowii]